MDTLGHRYLKPSLINYNNETEKKYEGTALQAAWFLDPILHLWYGMMTMYDTIVAPVDISSE